MRRWPKGELYRVFLDHAKFYCAAMFMVPLDAVQAELAALEYVAEIVVPCAGSVPWVLMIVLLEVSVIVMVKEPPVLVVAVARSVLLLMHMLEGMGTLPLYVVEAPL